MVGERDAAALHEERLADNRRRAETARLLGRVRATRDEARARYENEVVALNMGVARDVARRYYGRGIPGEDLDQVAYYGLTKAVRGFDATLGEDFLSYAVPTIRGEIRRYFRDHGWTIRPPRAVQEVQARVVAAESELIQELGREPRDTEIALHLDVSPDLVAASKAAGGCFTPDSLDLPTATGEDVREVVGDADPAFDDADTRMALEPLIARLDPRDRMIVEMRFFEHASQQQIGERVGLSQEQVSRTLKSILSRMRNSLVA